MSHDLRWAEALRPALEGSARVVLRVGDQRVTGYEVWRSGVGWAEALRADGVDEGSLVVADDLSPTTLLSLWLGAGLCGAALAPLHQRWPPPRKRAVIGFLRPQVVVACEPSASSLGESWAGVRAEQSDEAALRRGLGASSRRWAGDGETARRLAAPRPLALCLPTSGSTGPPKYVALSWTALHAAVEGIERHLGVSGGGWWYTPLPLYHIGGLVTCLRAFLGGPAAWIAPFSPAGGALALADEETIGGSLVPTMLVRLLEAGASPGPGLRRVLVGGGPFPRRLRERALGWPLCPTYGMTEACSQIATALPEHEPHPSASGAPLPGVEVRVVDVDDGGVGEIALRAATLFEGYLSLTDALDRSAFRDGWFYTGDLGRWRGAALEVICRRVDRIVTGGENVSPAEVEGVLEAHPDISEASVAGVDDPVWGQRVAALVVLRPGALWSPDAWAEAVRAEIGGHAVPRVWRPCEALPRTPTGKVERNQVREALGNSSAGGPPRG